MMFLSRFENVVLRDLRAPLIVLCATGLPVQTKISTPNDKQLAVEISVEGKIAEV